jgi:hypothetical protein
VTALAWDKIGERVYQSGVDRGVLYLNDGTVAVWNGLIEVEESSDSEVKAFYLDGVKYLQTITPSDFSATLKAYTYPDEFESAIGMVVTSGLTYHDQPPTSFNLSYRTKIGNDLEGTDFGYKIHILYNVMAVPDSSTFSTLTNEGLSPTELSWTLTATPPVTGRYRPTAHISLDSRQVTPSTLKALEDKLYGTDTIEPSLPSISDIAEFFGYYGALVIVDYEDGTWAAIDEGDNYITMLNETTFQIENADATFLDAATYTISSTNVAP